MNRFHAARTAGLLLAAGLVLGGGLARAELQPSSDQLVPYFEVDTHAFGRNTLFAVVNPIGLPVDLTITLYSNWGIPVLQVPLTLVPNQVQSVSLRDWISFGRLPDRTLSAPEIEHLKAALSGKASPKDGLYYGTAGVPDRAYGYVLIHATALPQPDALWGDYFVADADINYLYGDTLVNLDPAVTTLGTCKRHLIRFLEGGDFSAGTELFVWTGQRGHPSATPQATIAMEPTTTKAYDESGKSLGEHQYGTTSTEMMRVAEMGFTEKFGWLDITTADPTFIGARFTTRQVSSAAFHSYCLPEEQTGNAPAISLRKLTNGVHSEAAPGLVMPVGSTVLWQYFVQNTGNVRLTNVGVLDDSHVPVACPKVALDPGETMVCSASGVAVGCQYQNVATATGEAPSGLQVSASDTGYYWGDLGAALSLVTMVENDDANTPPGPTVPMGGTVHLTYKVTNAGLVALSGIAVTDDQGMAVSCPATTLAAGHSMTCTATEKATVGQHAHMGHVTANAPCGPALTAQDVAYHVSSEQPAIHLEKLVNGNDADTAPGPEIAIGSALLWTYVVTNTGNVSLTQVQVVDDKGVAVTCPKAALAAGESMTCTGAGIAVAGPYSNVGTVTAKPPNGPAISATDPCHYVGVTTGIGLRKLTNGYDAPLPPGPTIAIGAPVTWTYIVTNTGTTTLSNVGVVDDQGPDVTCPKATLQPAESMTCTATGTARAGLYTNVGTATGTPPVGSTVTASYTSHYTGQQPGDEGCSHGYWKNHTDSWPPTGYSTSQRIDAVFSEADHYPSLASLSLYDALSFSGGSDTTGAAADLLKQAVAALLNAAHPGIGFPLTPAGVIGSVNGALASGDRDTMLVLAANLDANNNLGCPLN